MKRIESGNGRLEGAEEEVRKLRGAPYFDGRKRGKGKKKEKNGRGKERKDLFTSQTCEEEIRTSKIGERFALSVCVCVRACVCVCVCVVKP